jgi:hypothetical protein
LVLYSYFFGGKGVKTQNGIAIDCCKSQQSDRHAIALLAFSFLKKKLNSE